MNYCWALNTGVMKNQEDLFCFFRPMPVSQLFKNRLGLWWLHHMVIAGKR